MRNWNLFYTFFSLFLFLGFYSTYEELKHDKNNSISIFVPVFTVPMRNWNMADEMGIGRCDLSFYSTYEELKPTNCTLQQPSLNCFYSTYEELKLKEKGMWQ